VIFSIYSIYYHEHREYGSPATRVQANCQMISLAYFTVDTFFIILSKFDLIFFIHHLVSIVTLANGSLFGIHGYIVCAVLLVGEISNPFMHLRWILHKINKHNNIMFTPLKI